MKYLLMIYDAEAEFAKAAAAGRIPEMIAGHERLHGELRAAGVDYSSARLQPTATAKTLADGAVHDGPFGETKEQLGGYYLVDVADIDEALTWAAKIPKLDGTRIEVRPLMERK
jgi:hypothetical protein